MIRTLAILAALTLAACVGDDAPPIDTDTAIASDAPFGAAPRTSAPKPTATTRARSGSRTLVAKAQATCAQPGPDYLPGPVTVRDRSRLSDPVPRSRPVRGVPASASLFRTYSTVCVTVSFDVDPDGTTARAKILYTRPNEADAAPFQSAAIAAVKTWRFTPGTLDGRAVIYPKNTASILFYDDGTADVR